MMRFHRLVVAGLTALVMSGTGWALVAEPASAAPAIRGLSVSHVTQTGAKLEAGELAPLGPATTCEFSYGPTAAYESEIPCEQGATIESGQAVSANLTGLTPSTLYYYRLVAKNSEGEVEAGGEFTTLPLLPAVTTGEASAVTRTSAIVGGEVNPVGNDTHYYVQYEYGAGGESDQSTPTFPGIDAGAGNAPVALGSAGTSKVVLSYLIPGTVYEYRLVATNGGGTTYGSSRTFTTSPPTPPSVVTGAAVGVSQGGATITGATDTQGLVGTYAFEVGPSSGQLDAIAFGPLEAQTGVQGVEAALGSLAPGTTYHYRLSVSTTDGTSRGTEGSFMTVAIVTPLVSAVQTFPDVTGVVPIPEAKEAVAKAPAHKKKKAKPRRRKRKGKRK